MENRNVQDDPLAQIHVNAWRSGCHYRAIKQHALPDNSGQLRSAYSIAVDGYGRVYVGDMKGIQVFDANGRYLTILDLKGIAFGMVFNDKNELFVVARDHVMKYAVQAQ